MSSSQTFSNNLLDFGDSFVLEGRNKQLFRIEKKSGHVFAIASKPSEQTTGTTITTFGVLGTLRLLGGHYLVHIKSAKEVADILPGHKIFMVKKVDLIQLDKSVKLTDEQNSDEAEYKQLVLNLFNSDNSSFYFSYTFDLTNNLQSQFSSGKNYREPANWKNVDELFMWNRYLAKDFISASCHEAVVPVIRGFISIQAQQIGDKGFDFIILSRVAWKRVGTRYNIRGSDQQGNVANFVETEQILRYNDLLMSYMQIRGSIPLFWSQKVNLKYKPRAAISQTKQSSAAFHQHAEMMLKRYNRVTMINLVDQKGNELELAFEFKRQTETFGNENIRYVDFDFHKETKGMRYENIVKVLVKNVEKDNETFGHFAFDLNSSQVIKRQQGVMRVNCIDCLDRTNVVESVFARTFLNKTLQELSVLSSNDSIQSHASFESTFKNAWGDNGDTLSFLYAGTPALKGDFTRTGKRSFVGVLNDGWNSCARYYLNNFCDGSTQDAMNLVLGKYIVDQGGVSPFVATRSTVKSIYKVLAVGFFVSLFMVAVNIFKLPSDEHFRDRVAFLMGWAVFSSILYLVLQRNGRDIVNNPILKHAKKEV